MVVIRNKQTGEEFGADFATSNEFSKRQGDYQIFDPNTKKSYTPGSAKAMELLGVTKQRAKSSKPLTESDLNQPKPPDQNSYLANQKDGMQLVDGVWRPIPGGPKDPQVTGATTDYEKAVEQQNKAIEEFRSKLDQSGDAFKQGFESIQSALGDQKDFFEKQMATIQSKTGMQIDFTAPGIQEAVQQAVGQGATDLESVLQPFLRAPEKIMNAGFDAQPVESLYSQAIQSGLPPELADSAMTAFKSGTLSPQQAEAYFSKFLTPPVQAETGVSNESQVKQEEAPIPGTGLEENPVQFNPTSGYAADIVEEQDLTTKISTSLGNLSSMSAGTASSFFTESGLDGSATSAELTQMWLLQQNLEVANDPTTKDYLARSLEAAKSSYDSALRTYGEGGTAVREIDKALGGKDFTPTTYEGLIAKTYQQSKDLQLESIELEKNYIKEQQDIWMKGETEKRGRLEGYLKAKLYSAGAQDSSAGLAVMAMQVNAADLRIQTQNSEYNYAIQKLNIEGRGAMIDYANNVTELTLGVQAQKDKAQGDYSTELLRIEGLAIADDKERKQLKLTALSTFSDNMYKIDQDKKKEEQYWYEQNYKKIRDAVDDAYKLSGLTGTIYASDAQGNVFDTGAETFDSLKWKDSQALGWANYNHGIEQDSFNRAIDLLDQVDVLGSTVIDSVEQLMGMPAGALSSVKDEIERKKIAENWMESMFTGASLTEDGWAMNGESPINGMYPDGTVGGQCGTFVRTKFFDLGSMGDSLQSKIASMDNVLNGHSIAGARGDDLPQIGDMLIQDVGAWTGHVALVNSINEDGTITLTESNWKGNEKVTNTRTIKRNDPSIVGIHRGDLKPEIAQALSTWQGKNAMVADLEQANFPGGVGSILANFINANSKAISNPFIAQTEGYNQMKEQVQGQQFSDQQVSIFNQYEDGDKIVAAKMEESPAMQVAYFTWKAQQSASVDPTAKASDIRLIMGKVTPTLREEIYDRAEKGGYAAELQAAEIGDFTALLGDQSKFTEPLAGAGVSADQISKIANKLYSGDTEGAKKDFQLQYVNNVLKTAEVKKDYAGRNQSMATMNELAEMIVAYEANTGKVAGSAEKMFNFIKETRDPELQVFKKKVDLALQSYTKLTSGAAFTEQEYERYKDNFPDIFSDKELNLARVRAFHETLIQQQSVDLNSYAGAYFNSFDEILTEAQKKQYLINY